MIEELLDHCDTTLDRVKVLYEQFFLGIQKQPPTHIHTDVERKLRELQQIQIRNTALRYRFATIQQKFGSYNNYWRRTLRQIENGTYHRNLAKIGRQAAMTGEEIPDEILAAMPKRMREQVKRDREAALAMKRRRDHSTDDADFLDEVATGAAPPPRMTTDGAHVLDDGDGDFDLDAYFRSVTNEEQTSPEARAFTAEVPTPTPAPRPAARVRAPTFESEPPTDADLDPQQRSAPVHPNPAVRAAVGMRTPPSGVPVTRRVTPTSMPAQNPSTRPSQPIPTQRASSPTASPSGGFPAIPRPQTGEPQDPSGRPLAPSQVSRPQPGEPRPPTQDPSGRPLAPSQVSRPLPVMPGASTMRAPVPVETLSGPFPREAQPQSGGHPVVRQPTDQQPSGPHPAARTTPGGFGRPSTPSRTTPPPPPGRTQPIKPTRPTTEPGVPAPRMGPPPGMTDADVNALYAKYVKAKEAVGEKAGPGAYGKLLQTINAQAPKIMEQYKAKGVDFQVVVKDNQVVIRAKPKP